MCQARTQVLACGLSHDLPPATWEVPTPLGPPQTLGYWCSSDSQRNKGEKYREKRLTKDVEFKSSLVGQLGGTVGHQAATRALIFPGHGMDGKCACGEKRARDGLGVIGEKP